MQVKNDTEYCSKQLGQLIRMVYRRGYGRYGKLRKWRTTVVYVGYSEKRNDYSGLATIGGREIWLKLPRSGARITLLTYLVDHELKHLYGYTHRDKEFPWHWPATFHRWRWTIPTFGLFLKKGTT